MKNEALKHKKKKSHKLSVILWGFVFGFISVLIMFLFAIGGAKTIGEILRERDYWLSVGVVIGLILIWYLMQYRIDAQSIALSENEMEDTEFLTAESLKKKNEFTVTNYGNLSNVKDGIVIGAEKKRKDIEVIMTKQLHALIVGTTGSGKTSGFVDQNISVLCETKTKPSLIITDPKKELYQKHAKHLEKQGYKISVLDLREPYLSEHWNPMQILIWRIILYKKLKHVECISGKYYADDIVFLRNSDAIKRKQEISDEIFENAKDLVYTICPIENKDQPSWEQGARDLILAIVLAFCEDIINGKMEASQLTLFNVYHNISKYCKEDTTFLKKYLLEGRDEFSKVPSLANTVLITQEKTLTSYLTDVNRYMQSLADDGILSLTSENGLDISQIDEMPNAVFVVVLDERFTRHKFVTLFMTQVYKELVEKANENLRKGEMKEAILKRNTYYIMDEFGNLPAVENLKGMITVGRSRGIRFLLVLQSFSQLTDIYGRDVGDIVKSNCNVKMYIGSDDYETRREFSELCGQKKVKHFSVNTSIESNASSSTGATNQPLISTGMLERLNGEIKGDAIVSITGYEPIWSHFTPSYKLNNVYFKYGQAESSKREAEIFDKNKIVFDILGNTPKKTENKMSDILCEMDEEMKKGSDAERNKIIDALDIEWGRVKAKIDKEVDEVARLLDGKDYVALKQAKLENKIDLLYALMDSYDFTRVQKMQKLANRLTLDFLPKLREIQNKTTGGKNQ